MDKMTAFLHIIRDLASTDMDITLAINSLHSTFTDGLWLLMSDKTTWMPLYVLAVVFLIWRLGWKKALTVVLMCALTVLACDQTSELLKYSAGRLRPCYNTETLDGGLRVLENRGGLFGFFSSHAANAFGFAMCFIAGLSMDKSRKYLGCKAIVLIWASLVSISRVFVGKHYFGDVLVGVLIGLFFGIVFGKLAIAISAALDRRKAAIATKLHKDGGIFARESKNTQSYGK